MYINNKKTSFKPSLSMPIILLGLLLLTKSISYAVEIPIKIFVDESVEGSLMFTSNPSIFIHESGQEGTLSGDIYWSLAPNEYTIVYVEIYDMDWTNIDQIFVGWEQVDPEQIFYLNVVQNISFVYGSDEEGAYWKVTISAIPF